MISQYLKYFSPQLFSERSGHIVHSMLITIVILFGSGCDLAIRVAALPLDAVSKTLEKSNDKAAEKRLKQARNEQLHMHGPKTKPHKHVNSGKGDHLLSFSCLANNEKGLSLAYPSNIYCGSTHMHGPDQAPHRHNTTDKNHGRGYDCIWKGSPGITSDKFCSDHDHAHIHLQPGLDAFHQKPPHKHLHEHTGTHEHKYVCHITGKGGGPSDKPCEHRHLHMHGPDSESHMHVHTHEDEHNHVAEADGHNHAPEASEKKYCRDTSFGHNYIPSNIACNGTHTHLHLHELNSAPHSHPHEFEGEHQHRKFCKYEGKNYPTDKYCLQ